MIFDVYSMKKLEGRMNTGQMFITIGAILLLGMVILRVNTGFLNTSTVMMESKFGVLATSIATSLIEEANGKSFDENTDTNSVSILSDLSAIGPDGSEVYPNFNDFDDFDGLVKVDSSMPSAIFNIFCNVDYVTTSAPETPSANKTWHKRMTVTVTSQSMSDTVRLSSIFSYFYFR